MNCLAHSQKQLVLKPLASSLSFFLPVLLLHWLTLPLLALGLLVPDSMQLVIGPVPGLVWLVLRPVRPVPQPVWLMLEFVPWSVRSCAFVASISH